MAQAGIEQIFKSDTDDLCYQILMAVGGTMADVKEIFKSKRDDILYAILLKLQGGAGGGGFNVISVRPTDPVNKTYPLPAKCFILFAIVKLDTNTNYEINAGDGVLPIVNIIPDTPYIAGERQTSSPCIEIVQATELKLQSSGQLDGLSLDIFYTTTTI